MNLIYVLTFLLKKYEHWSEDDWGKCLFSDESIIRQFDQPSQHMHVRRPSRKRCDKKYVATTVRSSPSVTMWASISGKGTGGLHIVSKGEPVNAERYLSIIAERIPNW